MDDLGELAQELKRESATDVLEDAYSHLKSRSLSVADDVYQELQILHLHPWISMDTKWEQLQQKCY